MAKKESLNLNPAKEAQAAGAAAESGPVKPKRFAAVLGRVFSVIKLAVGIILLPFVYAATAAFLNELNTIEKFGRQNFWAGLVAFLMIYLFVWEPAVIYARGQKILEAFFAFFKPLVRAAPYVIPIYAVILTGFYWFFAQFIHSPDMLYYFLFLLGASIGFHLVFGAKSLRAKQADFLKANYIFGFSFVYLLNVALVAFILNLSFEKYSLVNFLNNSFQSGRNILYIIFKQLFLF